MADLAVIVPSRGRPQRLREMLEAIRDTAENDVRVLVGLDDDDPADYSNLIGLEVDAVVYRGPRLSLSGWSNHLALQYLAGANPAPFVASLGDDHRPRTAGWDTKLLAAAHDVGGWAYGNDMLQGGKLPTAWVVRSDIVRQLGWLMLPACQHMYVDNAVLELGRRTNRIAYVPSVIVEHQHPLGGRTDWDESYRETNATERYAADKAAFESWLADGIDGDIATVGVRT